MLTGTWLVRDEFLWIVCAAGCCNCHVLSHDFFASGTVDVVDSSVGLMAIVWGVVLLAAVVRSIAGVRGVGLGVVIL